MSEEIEQMMKAQMDAMKAQIDGLRELIIDTEEHTAKLKHIIADELVETLIKRFQHNEKRIDDMHDRISNFHVEIKDQLLEVKRARERHLSDKALQKAINRLAEEAEIKVDAEPLYELKV